MLRPRSAAVLVASFALAFLAHAPGFAADTLEQARALLARDDARGAMAVLERALPAEPSTRGPLLDLLRQAYTLAARQAEAAGKTHDAEIYRDNLEILNRKPAPAAAQAPGSPRPRVDAEAPKPDRPAPAAQALRAPVDDAVAKSALPPAEVPPAAALAPPTENPPAVRPISNVTEPTAEPAGPAASSPPPAASSPPPAASSPPPAAAAPDATVAAADKAFHAKQYDDAGRLYGTLLREKRLPDSRRPHLAYCRCADVVRRINARPTQPEEWDRIDAEIRQIRELSPDNWYGEYLRNLASERSPAGRPRPSQKPATSSVSRPEDELFVRASAPEETPAAAAPPRRQPPAAAQASPPPAAGAGRPSAMPASWQVHETENFRILHADPAMAEQIARVAEQAREVQVKRWAGSAGRAPWSPRCDIYVYPNAKVFSQMTNQPEDSPGFSTMGLNAGKIIARRVNVRADHPNLLAAILPHEITHVVLADLFPHQQIPRWADEGMAVLSEPASEQRLRAADLEKPLASGRLFKLNQLMVMDYPDGKYWGLYYAQSVSLTRFLVDQGTPAQFVKFVQGAQQHGLEAELKRVYQIDGLDDLQKRWLAYARVNTAEATAAANNGSSATVNRE